MNTFSPRRLAIPLLAFALILGGTACSEGDTIGVSQEDRDRMEQEARDLLSDVEAAIADLEQQLSNATGSARAEIESQIDALEGDRGSLQDRIDDLENSSGDLLEKIESQLDSLINDIKERLESL